MIRNVPARRIRTRRRAVGLGALGLMVWLTLSGCTDAEPDPAEGLTTATDLQSLAATLNDGGVDCTLEYEGLRDGESTVSLCIVDDTQVTLRIWDDPGTVTDFVNSGMATESTAFGANWTIDARDPPLAAQIAEIAGGQVASGAGVEDGPVPTVD